MFYHNQKLGLTVTAAAREGWQWKARKAALRRTQILRYFDTSILNHRRCGLATDSPTALASEGIAY